MPFIKGQSYEWEEIISDPERVAGPVFYLLHRRDTELVTAACLDIAFNFRAPYEIWAGEGPEVKRWADILDAQVDSFDAFVRELDNRHYYRGRFRRIGSTRDANEIALRLAQAEERGPIYKLLFLEEVAP